jgi:acyl-CoA dehydrogenase
MLLESARGFCRDQGGIPAVRERLEGEHDYTPELWRAIVEMGWTGIGLPDAVGGSGLDIGAAVPVLESMGRYLMGTPLMSTLLAGQLLLRAAGESQHAALAALAAGRMAAVADLESEDTAGDVTTQIDAAGVLRGRKRLVMDGASADLLLVTAQRDGDAALAVLDREAIDSATLSPRTLIDLTHRAVDVSLDGVRASAVVEGPGVAAALRDYRLLGALLVAAESSGAAAACLDTIVDYLKTRKQFGRLIGSYQALKHPAVDILNGVDSSRSFIYHAATLVSQAALDRDAEAACRMAKAQATETLKFAADRAVQFHGGMGFTWECDAQLFLRRAQWAQQQFGDAQQHRRRLAVLLLDH